jgi:hypothetical protein
VNDVGMLTATAVDRAVTAVRMPRLLDAVKAPAGHR